MFVSLDNTYLTKIRCTHLNLLVLLVLLLFKINDVLKLLLRKHTFFYQTSLL